MKLRTWGAEVTREVEPPRELPCGVRAVRDGKSVWVAWRGETYRIEPAATRPGARPHEVEHGLFAPMPGKVTKVHVAEGETVVKGTSLLVLEAMKMEHEIRAPKDGRVLKLRFAAGQMVGLGDVLAEME